MVVFLTHAKAHSTMALILALYLAILIAPVFAQQKNPRSQVDSLYRRVWTLRSEGISPLLAPPFEHVVKLAPASRRTQLAGFGTVLARATRRRFHKSGLHCAEARIYGSSYQSGERARSERNLEEAESEARKAVRLAPQHSEAHRDLGRSTSFRGDLIARHCA